MSFRIRMRRDFERRLRGWNLPVEVLIDVRLRIEDLEHNPADQLHRIAEPFDGMTHVFPVADRSNRIYGYVFTLHVRYGTDEETIWIVGGGYERVAV